MLPVPQTLAVPPPPHVSGEAHEPHWMIPPQPSATGPQFAPASWQVRGWQLGDPHWFGVPPPPHVALPLHVPQSFVSPPQPSASTPQVAPRSVQLAGVQLGAPH